MCCDVLLLAIYMKMSSKSVTWTLEKISELIELYEAYPCLYNAKDSRYHNRDKKKGYFYLENTINVF